MVTFLALCRRNNGRANVLYVLWAFWSEDFLNCYCSCFSKGVLREDSQSGEVSLLVFFFFFWKWLFFFFFLVLSSVSFAFPNVKYRDRSFDLLSALPSMAVCQIFSRLGALSVGHPQCQVTPSSWSHHPWHITVPASLPCSVEKKRDFGVTAMFPLAARVVWMKC